MQGIYTYIPETNYVLRKYSVAAILLLLFMVLISLVIIIIKFHPITGHEGSDGSRCIALLFL